MTKQAMIEFINNNYEWFERMQKGLGHHSWWYTNRSPEDCINVKLHAWLDIDKLTARLSEQEVKVIKSLGLNLEEWVNDIVWGDFGMVEQARESMLEALRERFGVSDCEYGGRSGGWLAIVFEWQSIPDDYDNPEYTYKDIVKFYRNMNIALKEYEGAKELVTEHKHALESDIESVEYYIEQLREYVANNLEERQEEARRILAIPTL